MSLSTMVTNLESARSALVSAINKKGGTLSQSATIYQCASAVSLIQGDGGGYKFYKCASVDEETSTWSGYQALVAPNGVYIFSTSLTEGLSFKKFTPKVGGIYDQSASIIVDELWDGTPQNGLIFYSKFDGITTTAETGQSMTLNNISRQIIHGVPCLQFSAGSYIDVNDLHELQSISYNKSVSLSIWMCSTDTAIGSNNDSNNFLMHLYGVGSINRRTIASFYSRVPESVCFNFGGGNSVPGKKNVYDGKWHNIVATHDEATNVNNT